MTIWRAEDVSLPRAGPLGGLTLPTRAATTGESGGVSTTRCLTSNSALPLSFNSSRPGPSLPGSAFRNAASAMTGFTSIAPRFAHTTPSGKKRTSPAASFKRVSPCRPTTCARSTRPFLYSSHAPNSVISYGKNVGVTVGPEKLNVSFRSVAGLTGGSSFGRLSGGARSSNSTSAANVIRPRGENVSQIDWTPSLASAAFRSASTGQLFPPTWSDELAVARTGDRPLRAVEPHGRAGVNGGEAVEHDFVAIRRRRERLARPDRSRRVGRGHANDEPALHLLQRIRELGVVHRRVADVDAELVLAQVHARLLNDLGDEVAAAGGAEPADHLRVFRRKRREQRVVDRDVRAGDAQVDAGVWPFAGDASLDRDELPARGADQVDRGRRCRRRAWSSVSRRRERPRPGT